MMKSSEKVITTLFSVFVFDVLSVFLKYQMLLKQAE